MLVAEEVFIKKMVLLGDNGVGKTSLIHRFVDGNFSPRYQATLGTTFSTKNVTIDEKLVRLSIWDLAGQTLFRALLKEYAKGTEAAMVVCDGTRVATLWSLKTWLGFLDETAPNIPLMLLVNKTDLTDRRGDWDEHLERIGEGREASFFFTSAKTGEGVEEAFNEISRRMLKLNNVHAEEHSSSGES